MTDFEKVLKNAEQIAGFKFDAAQTAHTRQLFDEAVGLHEAEQSAKRLAAKRNRQAGFSDVEEIHTDDETDEDGSIRDRIRDYYKRTRKIVSG